jgi:hypothetical protein
MIKLELQMKMQAVRQHMVQCLTECWDELKPEWHDLPPNSSRELRFPRFGMDVEVSSRFPELAQHGLTLFTQTVKPDVDAVGVWTFSCSLALDQVREVFCFAMRTTSPTVVVTTDANGTICDAQGHPKLMPGYALIEEAESKEEEGRFNRFVDPLDLVVLPGAGRVRLRLELVKPRLGRHRAVLDEDC